MRKFEGEQEKLTAAEPSCTLERVALDITDEQEREQLLKRVDEQAQSALILTEGLLNYLTEQQVQAR